MGQAFKIPYGEKQGSLFHISGVKRGADCDCVCPVCKEPLIARKAEQTSHHFAHRPDSSCSAETVLHELGKRLLHARISAAINAGEPLNMTWPCPLCHGTHTGNLVKLAARAELESSLGPCRPDVTLINSKGLPVALIEIVVTHKPDETVRTYASQQRTPIVEFHLKSAEDLEALCGGDILSPTTVTHCTRPKCRRCDKPLHKKYLYVVEGDCWKCRRPMKVAFLSIEGMMHGPEDFSEQDVALARRQGAVLRPNYSNVREERYLSNTCPGCSRMVGSFYLHDYWDLMSPDNGTPTGNVCLDCDLPDR